MSYNSKYTGAEVEALLGKADTALQSIPEEYVTDGDLATVATSGSYNDLSNKPTIPSAVTESTVSGWGFTKNEGTITGITMNGASKGTSGVVNLGTVVTDVSGKQDKLVSGTNIKTINGLSLLGSGDIEISGGDSSGKLECVDVTPVISGTTATFTIPAGVVALCDTLEITSSITSVVLDLDFSSLEKETYYQFHIMYPDYFSQSLSIGSSQVASSGPMPQFWPNSSAPTLSATGGHLEISIFAGLYIVYNNLYALRLYGAWSDLIPTLPTT